MVCRVSTGSSEANWLRQTVLEEKQLLSKKCSSRFSNNFGWKVCSARVHLANDFHQVFGRHAFEQVSARSSVKGPFNFRIIGESRQNDDAGLRKFRSDRNHRVNAAHIRQPQIHEAYIGLVFLKLLNR